MAAGDTNRQPVGEQSHAAILAPVITLVRRDEDRCVSQERLGRAPLGVLTMPDTPAEPDHPRASARRSRPSGPHSRVLSVPPAPRVIARARRWVRETLTDWGLREFAEDAEQITSELATNALLHAQNDAPVVLLLMYAAGTLRIEVRDHAFSRQPIKRAPSITDEGGRGLLIVEAVSQRWGTRVTDISKAVWAELDLSGTPIASDGGEGTGACA